MNIPFKLLLLMTLAALAVIVGLPVCAATTHNAAHSAHNAAPDVTSATAPKDKSFTIVIDPGHGGDKPGAVSGRLLEKDLNLAIARKFGKLIEEGMPDVEVIYTRTGDTNPDLARRGDIANKADADLFFSIHTNAHATAQANGTSTFVMGMSKSAANLAEAMRENEVIKYEADYTETYNGFDPSSAESYIVFNLVQYAHFDRSHRLAGIVQKHYAKNTPMRNRGAGQGPYLVLWKAAMPSVLTEIGFISNESDRRFISSAEGQDKIARSLYDAFREYREAFPEKTAVRNPTPASTPTATPDPGWYIQMVATRSRMDTGDGSFGEYRGTIVERVTGGWYKYSIGPYETREEAAADLEKVRRNKKFKEAFITR